MMNAIAALLVLPFRIIGQYPMPSILGSAVLAVLCYFLKEGSALAFFVCLSSGIVMWYDETSRLSGSAPA
jgi:hypothetical protein